MDTKKALELITKLADGIDPITGEIYSSTSPYQKPDIIRALFKAKEGLEVMIDREKRKKNFPERAGEPWSDREEAEVCEQFDRGDDLSDIAKKHKRTIGAIRLRLIRKGKLENIPYQR